MTDQSVVCTYDPETQFVTYMVSDLYYHGPLSSSSNVIQEYVSKHYHELVHTSPHEDKQQESVD